jgi:hypothetical protein
MTRDVLCQIVPCHYHHAIVECIKKGFRDGAVVWMVRIGIACDVYRGVCPTSNCFGLEQSLFMRKSWLSGERLLFGVSIEAHTITHRHTYMR